MGKAIESVLQRLDDERSRTGRHSEVLRVPRAHFLELEQEASALSDYSAAVMSKPPPPRRTLRDELVFYGPCGAVRLEVNCGHPRQTWEGVDLPCAEPECPDGARPFVLFYTTVHRAGDGLGMKQLTWERQELSGVYGKAGPRVYLWCLRED